MSKLICPLCGNDISEPSKEVRTVWMGFYVCTRHNDDGTLESQMMALASKAGDNKNFLPNILKSQYSFFMSKQEEV